MKNKHIINGKKVLASKRKVDCRPGRSNYFDPYYSYLDRSKCQFKGLLAGNIPVWQEPLHRDFIRPVGIADLEKVAASVPLDFLEGLSAVVLPGGSKKQKATCWGSLFCYGAYDRQTIFLYPFPKEKIEVCYKRLPAPHVAREYLRAGATLEFKEQRWYRTFSEKALWEFYLYDVFVHEIGHHVDRFNDQKNYEKKERFAEWFATEYGFRRRKNY